MDRVIRARKLHHSRFYSLTLDYGHKAYLDKLTNDRLTIVRALERLERRTAEVLYAQRKWFKWVRERQDEEEAARVKESELIKKEAKLFRRHRQEMDARKKHLKMQEDLKRQEAFLDSAYQERQQSMTEEEDEEAWDPIEDAVEDERGSFVSLMKHLLWDESSTPVEMKDSATMESSLAAVVEESSSATPERKEEVEADKMKTKNARKRAKAKAKSVAAASTDTEPSTEIETAEDVKVEVNETRSAMRNRLLHGVRFTPGSAYGRGSVLVGSIENPYETMGQVPGMPAAEVDKILDEVSQIKGYLFCRLLLSQAAILPYALRAASVDEFLAESEVKTADLRDLCLRLEQPSLQEIGVLVQTSSAEKPKRPATESKSVPIARTTMKSTSKAR